MSLHRSDILPMSIVLIVSMILRLYRLNEPRAVVFDELHNMRDISMMLQRRFHFDTQPPLGKLIIAFIVKPFWQLKNELQLVTIGQVYPVDVPIFVSRLFPSLCGALLPLLVYYTMRQFQVKRSFATTTSFILAFDPALIVSCRVVQFDSLSSLFSMANCLFCYRLVTNQETNTLFNEILFGVTSVLAIGSKSSGGWTALSTAGLVIRSAFEKSKRPVLEKILRPVALFSIPLSLYSMLMMIHVMLMSKSSDDARLMTSRYRLALSDRPISDIHPVVVGSDITLKNLVSTRPCFLHSSSESSEKIDSDGYNSSEYQIVSCDSRRDVRHPWWTIQSPETGEAGDLLEHGSVIKLIHQDSGAILTSGDYPNPSSVGCCGRNSVCQSVEGNDYWRVVSETFVSRSTQNRFQQVINRREVGSIVFPFRSHLRLMNLYSGKVMRVSDSTLSLPSSNNKRKREVITDAQKRTVDRSDCWLIEETKTPHRHSWKPMGVVSKFVELQWRMLNPPRGFTCLSHPSHSHPWRWPLGVARPVIYWKSSSSLESIQLTSNTITWLLSIVIILFYILVYLRSDLCIVDVDRDMNKSTYLLLGTFLTNYIPWLVDRSKSSTLHSHLASLVFQLVASGYCLNQFYRCTCAKYRRRVRLLTTVVSSTMLISSFAVFIQQIPVIYHSSFPLAFQYFSDQTNH